MKRKIVFSVVSIFLLTGCTNQLQDINWKFWEYFQIGGDNEESVQEIPDETEDTEEEQPPMMEEPAEEIPENHEDLETDENEFLLDEPYFTVLNEKRIIENMDNILVLVNKEQSLPGDYVPEDLVIPDVPFSFDGDYDKKYLRKEAAEALERVFSAAKSDNIELFAISGYRSYETQYGIYNSYLKKWGEEKTNAVSAIPGHSEHQTGLAMDVSSRSAALDLTEEFGETPEGQWLKENAHTHGFIIRYPKEKEEITGYQYEPWHLRYVGNEVAEFIYKHDLTLEEFFDRAIKQ